MNLARAGSLYPSEPMPARHVGERTIQMSESLRSIPAITMFIEDRARAKEFYERVFDVTVVHEDDVSIAFKFENIVVNLLENRAAPGLIEPASVAGPEPGSRFQLTIGVEDTDAVCAQLAELGVELLNGPIDREWGIRTASFTDPDGHIWEVAGPIAS
jgi:catechol 2,3-dioxygenase-like lactoylglutathione lyase family enzyme